MTTTQSIQLFLRALQGQNYSPKTLRAYGDDLAQFLAWVEKNRVDFDIPTRFSRGDIEGFMQYLAAKRLTGVTRVRKLAAIRKFFTFLEENSILAANPAHTVKGARRRSRIFSIKSNTRHSCTRPPTTFGITQLSRLSCKRVSV